MLTDDELRELTPAQRQRVELVARRFRCWPDDVKLVPTLDPELTEVLIGERKGRPHLLALRPDGTIET